MDPRRIIIPSCIIIPLWWSPLLLLLLSFRLQHPIIMNRGSIPGINRNTCREILDQWESLRRKASLSKGINL